MTALGHELARRLRACHVVPASVLLAAAMHFLRLAQPASSPASTSPGPEVGSCHWMTGAILVAVVKLFQ